MDRVLQVECLDDSEGVGCVVIHIVTIGDLCRPAMATPIVGDDAITFREEE
ncbi:hypothetical protein D3C87_1919250 [compost metagenome]